MLSISTAHLPNTLQLFQRREPALTSAQAFHWLIEIRILSKERLEEPGSRNLFYRFLKSLWLKQLIFVLNILSNACGETT